MKLSAILSRPFAAVAIARSCHDGAYKCVGPDSEGADYEKTNSCGGTQDICGCSINSPNYCNLDNDKIESFKECCGGFEGYAASEC